VTELTGAEDVREIPEREALYLTVPGAISLAPGFDPGTRIELRPDPSLSLRLPGARVYWSDWALNPAPDESGGGADVAAIAARSPLGGRIAWFGLRLGQGATLDDSALLGRLVQNGVSWAAGVPSAAPAAWPRASRAALVITLDVEDEPRNAADMAAFLGERGLPGTFFVVSRLVLQDRALGETLRRAGEVGSQTSDHTPLAGLTAQDQRVRLRRSASEIEAWVGASPLGLRPPEETFDRNTLDAWQRVGGTYLVASNEARSASPEIHTVGAGSMVVLPRVLKDDYNIIVQDRVLRATSLGEAYLAGARKMRAIGGLAVLAGHTQIMREGPRIRALGTVADTVLAQGDWWIAGAAAAAAWWSARAAVDVTFDPLSGGFASGPGGPPPDLTVTTPVAEGLHGLWIDVVLPAAPEGLAPLVDGLPVDFVETGWGVRVPVGPATAGASHRISFTVVERDEARPAP
jgi:peptidoglycan/xylan/chitin deacetylase (PgdA/CDA1 family)